MKVRLLATHPIQYLTPWLRRLGSLEGLDFEVGYGCLPDSGAQGVGFDRAFLWDRPLLEGYRFRVLKQRFPRLHLDRFWGLWAQDLAAWLKECDVLLVTGWHSSLLVQGVLLARKRKIPVLARGDSWISAPRSRLHRQLVRLWLRQFSGFLVVGTRNRNYYLAHGIPEERLFPGPHVVDYPWFREQGEQEAWRRRDLRHKWGVEEEELVLLYVGKFQEVKNLPELFLALAQLGAMAPPLVLVGSGPEEQNWRGLARELGLPVTWHGFANQSELPAIYRAADVLVLPSRRETWGLVVNEGMACGIPALVSDAVGCMPDLVLESKTGWVYPSGDVSALAAVLRQIGNDPSRVRSMRDTVIRHVETVCSLDTLVEGTLAAVRRVTAGRKR